MRVACVVTEGMGEVASGKNCEQKAVGCVVRSQ